MCFRCSHKKICNIEHFYNSQLDGLAAFTKNSLLLQRKIDFGCSTYKKASGNKMVNGIHRGPGQKRWTAHWTLNTYSQWLPHEWNVLQAPCWALTNVNSNGEINKKRAYAIVCVRAQYYTAYKIHSQSQRQNDMQWNENSTSESVKLEEWFNSMLHPVVMYYFQIKRKLFVEHGTHSSRINLIVSNHSKYMYTQWRKKREQWIDSELLDLRERYMLLWRKSVNDWCTRIIDNMSTTQTSKKNKRTMENWKWSNVTKMSQILPCNRWVKALNRKKINDLID